MTPAETIQAFAAAFVNLEFRERFVHEAMKKPEKLHERVCHRIEELFPQQYKNQSVQFDEMAHCLVLGLRRGLQETTWREAYKQTGLGGGLLIIDMSATKFYAETEGNPRSEVWAGGR
ncbi:hypothetical protein [Rhodoferax sp.]|jgi:hypothetical protein|uniref:hypothetical protein n=1 Tax=Rhodoferax sp. TaxID=50421 RepID=UPI003784B3B6